jgi:two-component system cell cycle response regulator DivK
MGGRIVKTAMPLFMTRRVLVVDDNPVTRELIREVLDSPDLQVLEAADGRKLSKGSEQPDLVLLDIRIPGQSGFDVLRQIREDPRLDSMRVLAFTAFAMHEERRKALAAGFDGYITKPINPSELRKQIESLLPL